MTVLIVGTVVALLAVGYWASIRLVEEEIAAQDADQASR